MAGRGGKSSTLTREQLQSMGVSGKEVNTAQLPPPLFPPLVNKPGPPDDNMERQYKILWKEDFVSFLKDSPYFATSKNIKSDQTNNDSVQKTKEKPNYCWNLMPPELKPNFKRTGAGTTKSGSTAKPALVRRIRPGLSVDEKLKLLEEKEKQGTTPLDPKKIKKEPGDLEEDDEEMDEGGVEDDEMDDENDYGNSYFDNGEAFNDEDDNLDDGPVY